MASTTKTFKTMCIFVKSMKVEKKYICLSDYSAMKQEDQAKEKRLVISDDTFALCDLLESLTVSINAVRLKNG